MSNRDGGGSPAFQPGMFDIDVRHPETARCVKRLLELEAAEREAVGLRDALQAYGEAYTMGKGDGTYRLRIFAGEDDPEVLAIVEVRVLTGDRKVRADIAERMWTPDEPQE